MRFFEFAANAQRTQIRDTSAKCERGLSEGIPLGAIRGTMLQTTAQSAMAIRSEAITL
jgi:hypothetical protein